MHTPVVPVMILSYLLNDLNDGAHDIEATCHRIKFTNRQFLGFAFVSAVFMSISCFVWEGTIPLPGGIDVTIWKAVHSLA